MTVLANEKFTDEKSKMSQNFVNSNRYNFLEKKREEIFVSSSLRRFYNKYINI